MCNLVESRTTERAINLIDWLRAPVRESGVVNITPYSILAIQVRYCE